MKTKKSSMCKSQESNQDSINPNRLMIARERNHFTKKKLAELIHKTTRSISAWESETGDINATDETIDELAKALGFPKKFFFGNNIERTPIDSVSFRALSKMTAGRRNAALATGDIGIYLNEWIENHFDLPEAKLPDFRNDSPDSAATMLRQYWGIGLKPISNLIHLLEANGVRVYSLSEDCNVVDAFSFWRESTPFVFLNINKTAERSRFDAAHELGHLLLHKHAAPSGQEAEKQADEFASAFLMPADSMYAANFNPKITSLIKTKRKWNVSLLALIVRMHRLGIISEWKYRSLCIKVQQDYGRTEPNGIERETSQVLNKVFRSLWVEGLTVDKIANELSLPLSEIKSLVFGLITNTNLNEGEQIQGLRLVSN